MNQRKHEGMKEERKENEIESLISLFDSFMMQSQFQATSSFGERYAALHHYITFPPIRYKSASNL